MNNEIIEKIKDLVVLVSPQNDKTKINKDTNLIDDLMLDSIGMMELVVELEDAFGIEFDEDDLIIDKISTFGRLYEIVSNKCNL